MYKPLLFNKLSPYFQKPISCFLLIWKTQKQLQSVTLCICSTTYVVLELRFMWAIYILVYILCVVAKEKSWKDDSNQTKHSKSLNISLRGLINMAKNYYKLCYMRLEISNKTSFVLFIFTFKQSMLFNHTHSEAVNTYLVSFGLVSLNWTIYITILSDLYRTK